MTTPLRATIADIRRIPLRIFEDERGWFCELRRESLLPEPTVQTNVSLSKQGVIRGLHWHARGQSDLFACLQGMARVVVLDRETGETSTEDIGSDNPGVAVARLMAGLGAGVARALPRDPPPPVPYPSRSARTQPRLVKPWPST